MESEWRFTVFNIFGGHTGFQLAARIVTPGPFFGRYLVKRTNSNGAIYNVSAPGQVPTVVLQFTVLPGVRFPYFGFDVVPD